MIDVPLITYNLAANRSGVQGEVDALLLSKPVALSLQEAVGYRLHEHSGYVLLRDDSTRSRANVAAYVRKDWPLEYEPRWIDLTEEWDRTKHPGIHEPRSLMAWRMRGVQMLNVHMPPLGTNNHVKAQAEMLQRMERVMEPWRYREGLNLRSRRRPRIAIGDFNGQGPRFAGMINGMNAAGDTDTAAAVHARLLAVNSIYRANGVVMQSDHKRAVRMTYGVSSRYAKP